MKKEKKKIQVLRMMSEGQVKDFAMNRWMNKKYKIAMVSLLAWVAYAGTICYLLPNDLLSACIEIVPALVLITVGYIMSAKASNKFWNEVKDKAQPVDLG